MAARSTRSLHVRLAQPRGFCAGVERAIEIVERALDLYGPPVYVRHEIVHNRHVVESLRAKGAVFVDSPEEVPEGAVMVLSAHGSAPDIYARCAARNLEVIDATCPLVSKVHAEVRRRMAEAHPRVAPPSDVGPVPVEPGTLGTWTEVGPA